ncbi:hypothetical protein ID0086_15330 [Helicobacter pylori]
MLLDYDFLLLLNDESGNPTRYYYLLQDFEKDFVAREVAQNRTKRLEAAILKRCVRKSKAHYPLGSSHPSNPLKTLFTGILIIMSKNYS